jgi:predicted dehydrogenase
LIGGAQFERIASVGPKKIRWGILGVARIAVRRVIPAMRACQQCEVAAVASRDLRKAEEVARSLGIPRAYGSYDELLADPEIDVIYNPLPNHLHVPWSVRAAEAGKHVLCEKPIAMNATEARQLIEARDRAKVKIGEAFMVRTHPRWLRVQQMIREGRIGDLRVISGWCGYFNRDPMDVRNTLEYGGGALLDIGCYLVALSRFIFEQEPARVSALIERDPEMRTDRLTSGILEFSTGRAIFTCATQIGYHQRMIFFGTKGRIEIDRPINPTLNEPSKIVIDDNPAAPDGAGVTTELIPACNQFTIQADLFSQAVREGHEVPVPVDDSVKNMAAIDAIFRSAESGLWEKP